MVGRGRELHLAALGQRPPARQDPGEHPPLGLQDQGHVGGLVVAPAQGQLAQSRVVGQRPEAHPGQVEEDLEVAIFTYRERGNHLVQIHPGQVPSALLEELQISRHGARRAVPVDHEEGVEQPAPLLRGEVGRVAGRDLQDGVAGPAGHVVLELVEQHRGEVHRAPDPGVALQHPGHVGVGPGGVEPHPGKHVGTRGRLPVEGLVHVPEEGQPHRLRHRAGAPVGATTPGTGAAVR